MYVDKTYNFKERTDLGIFYDGIFKSIFVEIKTNYFEKTLIDVIYRPPEYSNLDLFNEYIKTILHKLSKTKNPSFMMGDFNIDMLNMTDTTFFSSFGVHPLRMTTSSSSTLKVGFTVAEEANA